MNSFIYDSECSDDSNLHLIGELVDDGETIRVGSFTIKFRNKVDVTEYFGKAEIDEFIADLLCSYRVDFADEREKRKA